MSRSEREDAEPGASGRVELLQLLDELIALEHALVSEYMMATRRLSAGGSRDQLLRFMDNHQQHVSELRACRQAVGGDEASAQWRPVPGMLDSVGAHSAASWAETLRSLWSSEGVAAQAYEEALGNAPAEPTVRSVLRDACEDTRDHWTWIAFRVAQEHGTPDFA